MSKELTMTEEVMEVATDDVVIEAADAIVAGDDIDLMKVGKTIGAVALVAGVGYLIYKKGIPFVKNLMKKDAAETVDCDPEDYAEAVPEDEVGVEDTEE